MRIVLGVVIVSALLGGVSPRARADYYGSLAYDFSSGGYGVSHDYSSQESAKANARAACQQKNAGYCKIIVTFDSCGAMSVGANLEGYWGIGQNKELAARRAMNACRTHDPGPCTPLVSICNQWDVGGYTGKNDHPNQDAADRRLRDERQGCLDFPHQGRCP